MQSLSFRVVFSILLTTISLEAQWSDRLYPFRELTDGMRARIDLRDGSVEDWEEILGAPTLTPLDFATHPGFPSEYDPSSFDFRIWLAWHGAGNHLFVAAEIVDDIYAGEWPGLAAHSPHEATVDFSVDGDRSGGTVVETDDHVVFEDITMDQAQWYWAVAENVAENHGKSSNVFLTWVGTDSPWVQEVPYADGGGRVLDSQPVFYVVEFYVTAFDRLIRDAPEQSLVSELSAGKMIEFAMTLADAEPDPFTADSLHQLFGPDASLDRNRDLMRTSDLWAHGILLGADDDSGGTSVETVSWARIKAGLSE